MLYPSQWRQPVRGRGVFGEDIPYFFNNYSAPRGKELAIEDKQ